MCPTVYGRSHENYQSETEKITHSRNDGWLKTSVSLSFLPRFHQNYKEKGVPVMAQWVKNLTAAAQEEAEAKIQSLAQELPPAMGAAIKIHK